MCIGGGGVRHENNLFFHFHSSCMFTEKYPRSKAINFVIYHSNQISIWSNLIYFNFDLIGFHFFKINYEIHKLFPHQTSHHIPYKIYGAVSSFPVLVITCWSLIWFPIAQDFSSIKVFNSKTATSALYTSPLHSQVSAKLHNLTNIYRDQIERLEIQGLKLQLSLIIVGCHPMWMLSNATFSTSCRPCMHWDVSVCSPPRGSFRCAS